MPGPVPKPTPIIHMTHVSNMPVILASGALRPTAMLQAKAFDVRVNRGWYY